MEIRWEDSAKEKFDKIIKSLPQFHRTIAQRLVFQKAEELARGRDSSLVEDEDLIQAFFQEVPPAFKGMMERLFNQHGIDYSKYTGKQEK